MGWKPARTALALSLAAGALSVAPEAAAVEPTRFTGSIGGRVTDQAGVPQMGAAVLLFDRFERQIARAITDELGFFHFRSLPPQAYGVRVSLASFVPAFKYGIAVRPGLQSFLAVDLDSLLSSIELIYTPPGERTVMSEQWKWVLRGAGATRPILRLSPVAAGDPARDPQHAGLFSDTHGLLRFSNGGSGALAAAGSQTDLGTAFALATSLFGRHQLEFSGNLGYASHSGAPSAGFRTGFSRAGAATEVNLTMRQLFLPARVGAAIVGAQPEGLPPLESISVAYVDRRRLAEGVDFEYGSTLESVSFLSRLNFASPFARLRWGFPEEGSLVLAFSSGAAPVELLGPGEASGAVMDHDIASLALFPRVSLRRGVAQVQRTENFEIGYRRVHGTHSFGASAFRERVSNAAFTVAAPAGFFHSSSLLPDLASSSSIFNAGNYERVGYTLSFTEALAEQLAATVAYGYVGGLGVDAASPVGSDPGDLRSRLHQARRHSLAARINGVVPRAGTLYAAAYQWTDYTVFHPVHLSIGDRAAPRPGLNISLRQPIPGVAGMIPGRIEATADLQNLLAQGYVPVSTSDGRRVLLIPSPRAVRGGLNFIF